MPKNAVQKLQDIESNIKTVISLYEFANKSSKNDKPEASKKQNPQQFPQVGAPKRLETSAKFDKFREVPGKAQTELFDTVKKTGGLFSRPSQGFSSRESITAKKRVQNKPGSAPSSSSTINTISESDFIWQKWSEASALERGNVAKAKTSDNLSLDWFDSATLATLDLFMTPSKTLETANEILAKNNFNEGETSREFERVLCSEEMRNVTISEEKKTAENSLTVKKSYSNKNSVVDLKNRKKEIKTSGRSRSGSPAETISVEHVIECNVPVAPKSVVTTTMYSSTEKLRDVYRKFYVHPKHGHKMDQNDSKSILQKSATSTPSKNPLKCFKIKKSDQRIEGNLENKGDYNNDESAEKNSFVKMQEQTTGSQLEQKRSSTILKKEPSVVQFSQVVGDVQDIQQKIKKPTGKNDDAHLWMYELNRIIAKSNEKLEMMKVSKEIALDIANHFKEKYDQMQKSKGELLEKLHVAEKNNEKLNTEVKVARESKKKLPKKTEGLKEDVTEEIQEEVQLSEVSGEIANLKAILQEKQKEYNEKLHEKNKIIESIQMERLVENRSILKSQEILTRKLQKLTNEKCELLSRFDELRRQLRDSKSTTQSLQDTIRQLEEEVQKQKQHLKIKTETLHETNRELEMIRVNCTDLEDQVRILRKNIEEFDGVQHTLIRKATDYEQQIKLNQEKIKELHDENSRLKDELNNEKDGLRIKVKIIEDQQQTIKQLKEKSEDAKTLLKRNQSLERILNIEREEKSELEDALQRLKRRKDELKEKVKILENDCLLAPQEVVRDLQKTQIVLHELENQIQVKQKEWEIQLQSLIREKEQACSVAEFATKKLMETTSEFQKQSQAYKDLQRIVTRNLAVKERHHFRESNKKLLFITNHFAQQLTLNEAKQFSAKSQQTTATNQQPTGRVQSFPYLEILGKKAVVKFPYSKVH